MICYLVSDGADYTIGDYLGSTGKPLASRITVMTYESLPRQREFPPAAAYIFSDIERLTPARLALAVRLRQRLEAVSPDTLILNHPVRTQRRYELLRSLHARGINSFQVRRLSEPLDGLHYPVFLRLEDDHGGSLTPLLHNATQVRQAIAAIRWRGLPARQLLVTEFCDTADAEGVYRKYSAFIIGDEIIPRHLLFGRRWMLKHPELSDDALAQEQRAYVEANPHADVLRDIFHQAGVGFGRMDYSLLDGAVQVWEINTNPMIMRAVSTYKSRNAATHELFARRIKAAFERLDRDMDSGPSVRVNFGRLAGTRLATEQAAEFVAAKRFKLIRKLLPMKRSPLLIDRRNRWS